LRGRLAGIEKLAWLKIEREWFHRHEYSYVCLLFNPGRVMLLPDSSQPDKSRDCNFDERLEPLCVIEKDIKE
jgi:hypothetical protein